MRADLGHLAETEFARLVDGYELGADFEWALVVGDEPTARSEVAARLRERAPIHDEVPDASGLLVRLEQWLEHAPADPRPIVWVELPRWDRDAWARTLARLNQDREWLRHNLRALLVLAGPRELEVMAAERPDLWSVVGPVVRLEGKPVPVDSGNRPSLCWLHLSDLHFRATQRWERCRVLTSLLAFLRQDADAGGPTPQFVTVTGDIADKGREAEYDRAEDFLRQLLETLQLDPAQHLFLVPGNHDVDRTAIKSDRYTLNGVRQEGTQQAIEDLLSSDAAMRQLAPRLAEFYKFTGRLLGPSRAWQPGRPWRADMLDVPGCTLGIVQLNTAWASGEKGEAKQRKLLLGKAQVCEAMAELPSNARPRIALLHHPLTALPEFDEKPVAELLRGPDGVDFLLRGHLHEEETFVVQYPGNQTVELAAGATYVEGSWHKGCLLVELDETARELRTHFLSFSERDGGFWHRDGSRYRDVSDGIWTHTLLGAVAASSARPRRAVAAADRQRILATRYCMAAAMAHGSVSYLGLPERDRRPVNARVEDLFAPLTAGPRGQQGGGGRTVAELAAALDAPPSGGGAARIVLLGGPGSGKTTLSRYLTVWAGGYLDIPGVHRSLPRLPLRIPVREYTSGQELIDLLVEQAHRDLNVTVDRDFFEHALERGEAVVLLDGLDEVSHSVDREALSNRVATFATRWPNTPLLVTSRIAGYDEAPLACARATDRDGDDAPACFEHLELRPLRDSAIDELVKRWYTAREPDDRRGRQVLIRDLLDALAAALQVRELADNPLLATMICLVHGQRARLPVERAKLYELVVDTLLETWVEAKKRGEGGFREIDAGRQRRYLQRLALQMQEERAQAAEDRTRLQRPGREHGSVTIELGALVDRLTDIACDTSTSDDERATVRHRVRRWVDHLAKRTGLLVEQRPGVFVFLHLTLMEFLAACALSEEAGSKDTLVERLDGRVEGTIWHETLLLVIGLRADDTEFVRSLIIRLRDRDPARSLLLMQALREEVDASGEQREQVVREALRRCAGTHAHDDEEGALAATLEQVVRFSGRNGSGAREVVGAVLAEATECVDLSSVVLARLSNLLGDPKLVVEHVDRLRRLTRDGEHLFFLHAALETAAQRWPDHAGHAKRVIATLFDHIPAPHGSLFASIRIGDRSEHLWRPIPAGRFRMGSPDTEEDRLNNEGPQHDVTIATAFQIGCVPVTNEQYAAFDPDKEPRVCTGVSAKELHAHPRVDVSWHEAVSFCRWLATVDGCAGARLPTEAEWEYTCRACTTTRFWSGNSEDKLELIGWFNKNSGNRTHAVGEKPANPWGLHDLHGNVCEWSEDDWHGSYEGAPDDGRAWVDSPRGAERVFRGGDSENVTHRCRSASRFANYPSNRWRNRGFRVVLPAPDP